MAEDTDTLELVCSICGAVLVGEPDDQPDWPTGPMCGNCYQGREMDNELWWSTQEGEAE